MNIVAAVLPRDLIEFISGGHCSEFRQGRVLPDKVEARPFLFVRSRRAPMTARRAEERIRAAFSLPVTPYDLASTRS